MNVTKRPVAYNLGSNSAVLWWETDSTELGGHGLNVSLSGSPEQFYAADSKIFRKSDGTGVSVHRVELRDLDADEIFTVRVVGPFYLGTVQYTYPTLGTDDDISFMVVNNLEGNYADLDYLIANKHTSVDALLSCGDLQPIGESLSYDDWLGVYNSLGSFLETAVGVIVAPSEKAKTPNGLSMLTSSPSQSPYFAKTLGRMRIICLDTSKSARNTLIAGGSQTRWFLNEVQKDEWKNASYRVILGSVPPATSLWSSDGTYKDGKDPFLFNNLIPLIKESGSNLCIFGGGHSYQRGVIASDYEGFEDLPIHYIVCSGFNSPHINEVGSWGATTDPTFLISSSDRHYVRMDVYSSSLDIIAREWDSDAIIDQISLSPRNLD